MSTFRLNEVADLLGVSPDSARRWIDDGRLSSSLDPRGHRVVDGKALVEFARLLAEHGDGRTERASARNRMRGVVTHVIRDNVMAQVEMRVGAHRVVSLMSREAADELGLAPGVAAFATFKSTDVMIESPAST